MRQYENPTEMCTCTTQSENKRRKQQRARASLRPPSATAPTNRDTPNGIRKSPICVVLKTCHLNGRDPELRPNLQISGFRFMGFSLFFRSFKSWNACKQSDCCTEPNCYVNTECADKRNKIKQKTRCEERETTTWNTEHGSA